MFLYIQSISLLSITHTNNPSPVSNHLPCFPLNLYSRMGCHSSKQARRDLHRSPSPLPRSKSLPDNGHVVSLTSSTLGSLNLDSIQEEKQSNGGDMGNRGGLCVELAKARAWSEMIDRKIPRTPTETPPNEPEPIDALELMDGFHGDYSPLDRRSFSFYPAGHFGPIYTADHVVEPNSTSDSSSRNGGDAEEMEDSEQSIQAKDIGKENAVVFYFTSLRGIRKTYDDCCSVKAMLREYCVRIDERDVSMHGGFKEELKEMNRDGSCTLPIVFLHGRDLGGADELKRMHENGELAKVFEGCAKDSSEKGGTGEECEACGDIRFVLCGHCSGSCRVYVNQDDEEIGGDGGWRRCSDCNENGIVRCSVCC